jgi:3-oxoacyl-[acyl-carrier-protein] synthase-3
VLVEAEVDRVRLDVVMYFGSMSRDYALWQAAPWIAHRIRATNAYAVEYDNVSCGTPVALRMARDMLLAEDELGTVLLVAACRESYVLDYANACSRFMFNFGDGAVAGLLVKDGGRNEVLGCHAVTDGSFSLQVRHPHEAVDAPCASRRARTRRVARRLPRRHGSHERGRPAARARPRRPSRRAARG